MTHEEGSRFDSPATGRRSTVSGNDSGDVGLGSNPPSVTRTIVVGLLLFVVFGAIGGALFVGVTERIATNVVTELQTKEKVTTQHDIDARIAEFFDALQQVESGGEPDPANAVGKSGERGPLQITRAYYTDSGYAALPYEEACRDALASRLIVEGYMKRYAPEAWARLDFEVLAHVHNRGPAGATYWRKVRKAMR